MHVILFDVTCMPVFPVTKTQLRPGVIFENKAFHGGKVHSKNKPMVLFSEEGN